MSEPEAPQTPELEADAEVASAATTEVADCVQQLAQALSKHQDAAGSDDTALSMLEVRLRLNVIKHICSGQNPHHALSDPMPGVCRP